MTPEALLRERFGLREFRPGQREVIQALLTQGAALAVFPTGGGKSLCYQLPALLLDGVTLVVSPLIALMKDQIDFLHRRGIPAARLDSSLSLDELRNVDTEMRAGTLKLLYVAPERFNNERFLRQLERVRIALFAVDEAHCISEWGHNFRPDYLTLAETARALKAERVLALTATATPTVVQDICAGFRIPAECAVVTGFYRPNLAIQTTPTRAEERDGRLLERLRTRPPGPTIVYVTLQRTAERVADHLAGSGLPARAYHAGLEGAARAAVQQWWMAAEAGIVVATIAFGMGIDRADVRYVYHYNLPKGLESYSQEIGRAGRDGEDSVVELLACPDDVPTLENFAHGDMPTDSALRGLVREVLAAGPSFAVNQVELSTRHDLRPLVLRTALTYLELLGVIRQGTPFYATYDVRPHIPLAEIVAKFRGERAHFLDSVFASATHGRTRVTLQPDAVAEALGQDRDRIVRALGYLEEQGWVELRLSDARQRYTRLAATADAEALTAELCRRYSRREAQEVARIRQVLALVTHPGCQANALAAHFGEQRGSPCGHCTWCRSGRPQAFPPVAPLPPIEHALDTSDFRRLCADQPAALREPRQQARFLCGLSSPALTRARLTRQPLFGALERWRFADVLEWCARLTADLR